MKRIYVILLTICLLALPAAALAGASGSISARATGDVNIRETPNLDGEQIAVLKAGTTATFAYDTSVDDRGVMWYKVHCDGGTGWVSSRYSVLTDGTTVDMHYDAAHRDSTMIVLGDDGLRSAPGGSEGALLHTGDKVKYLGFSYTAGGDVWYYVSGNGSIGWINRQNISSGF